MFKSIERFAELYERRGTHFEIIKDTLWVESNRMVAPVGPAKFNYTISKEDGGYLLTKFPKALLVRYTDGIQNDKLVGEWYAVICDTFLDLNELPAKNRSEIRRGLKNCDVKMVDSDFIAEHGYHVYASALENYTGAKIKAITENQFKRNILLEKDFHDIRHYWGVLHNDKLIAYSANYIYDTIEVDYTAIKFHPDYLKLYPSYALIYTMNQYYLKEKSFEYVNDGFRNILHQTNIQKYLIEKFRFRKEYTNYNLNIG